MKWTVSIVVAHTEQGDHRETATNDIEAGSQASAAGAALAEGVPFQLTADDELLIFVTPSHAQAQPEEIVWDIDREPLSREKCLRSADEQDDTRIADYWRAQAPLYKPEAEGGGLTDEEAARRKTEDEAWHKRQREPYRRT